MKIKQRETLMDSVVNSLNSNDDAGEIENAINSENEETEIIDLENKDKTKQNTAIEKPPIKKPYVFVAVFMILFTIIGVISSSIFIRDKAISIKERHALKEEFARFVYPVVINDPPAYDSVNNLRPSTIITSAIWKIILTADMSNYATDIGVIYIPAADVEVSARSIFGTGTLEHQTVSSQGIQFIYSSQKNTYEIPENPSLFAASPLITDVTNIGELYTVTVDYIAPSPLKVAGIDHDDDPIKTMVYTITRTNMGEKMTITSIKVSDATPLSP